MHTVLEIPRLVNSIVLDPPLTDEEFERLCMTTEFFKLERTKEGKIIVNLPASLEGGIANSEITYQLCTWGKEYQCGDVFGANVGFFLPDGSSLSPSAGYITAEQLHSMTEEDFKHFPRFAPAFVIELLWRSESLSALKAKMNSWMTNGTKLGWLIDLCQRSVVVYELGKAPRLETGNRVEGTGLVEGFVLDLTSVWDPD